MGLMNKFFGGGSTDSKPGSTQFAESQNGTSVDKTKSVNAPRRDLIRVCLRETMRKHGIPSDWVDVRSLSVLTRQHKSGMHVQFLVHKADHQLLPYIHAFQESFWEQVLRLDPLAKNWLFSVGWEFYEPSVQGFSGMPDLEKFKKDQEARAAQVDSELPKDAGDTLPPDEADDLATDLAALHSLMSQPADLSNLPNAEPRPHKPVR